MLKRIWLMLCILGLVFANPTYAADNAEEDVAENVATIGFRYWIDGDVAHLKDIEVSSDAIIDKVLKESIDIKDLAQGKHVLSYQMKGSDETFSQVYNVHFYVANLNTDETVETVSPILEYEYWIKDYSEKQKENYTQEDIHISASLSDYSAGCYTLYYDAITESGDRSYGYKDFMFANAADEDIADDNSVSMCQYWIDGDVAKMNFKELKEAETGFDLDVDVTGLAAGKHILYYNLVCANGEWGRIMSKAFFVDDSKLEDKEEENSPIIGFRKGFNDKVETSSVTAVLEYSLPEAERNQKFDMMELASPAPMTVTFNQNFATMSSNTPVTYFLQFQNKQGDWSEPAFVTEVVPFEITKEIKSLDVNSSAYVEGLNHADFDVIKFELSQAGTYNFSTLSTASVALYKGTSYDAELLDKVNAEEGYERNMDAGTYYVIIYNQPNSGSFRIASAGVKILTTPKITFDEDTKLVSISSSQEGAVIYYTLDATDPTSASTPYEKPFKVERSRNVKAVAICEGYANSHIASYSLSSLDKDKCEPVEFEFDGRNLSMKTKTTGAKIYYTTDAESEPSTLYSGVSLVLTDITEVRAMAKVDYMEGADVTSFTTPSVYDGKTAKVHTPGSLKKAFDWCGGVPTTSLSINRLYVEGDLNAEDITYIKGLTNVSILNMTAAQIETLADQAFASMPVLAVYLPSSLTSCGKEIFTGCKSLATVIWTSEQKMPANVLDGIVNPNLLLYVNRAELAPSGFGNVVTSGNSGGRALSITLSSVGENSTSYGNFYCPEMFTADNISYTRSFEQTTAIGKDVKGQGWETIVLPFDVATISHVASNKEITPFAALGSLGMSYENAKPFWLCYLKDNSFVDASYMQAGVPYIIAMPNNADYADRFNLNGKVTFSATNAKVEVTPLDQRMDDKFEPSYVYTPKSNSFLSLNVNQEYDGNQPGSLFAQNSFDINPFEAYMPLEQVNTSRFYIGENRSNTTGLFEIPMKTDAGLQVWVDGGKLCLRGKSSAKVRIYNINGVLCKSIEVGSDVTTISDLYPGIYLVGKKKFVIK